MKKRFLSMAWLSISLATLFSGISFAGTWVKTGNLWRYRVGKHFYRNQWAEIDGEWYYFKPTGSMAKQEWVEQQGSWYYLLPNGTMAKNQWIEDYYLLGDGSMARNQEIDGKYLGEDGKRDQAQEQAMAEAARQAKIQEAKNKGYTVIQGRVEIWTYYNWIKARNYGEMYYRSFDNRFNKKFGILDFVKPERVWMEYAAGDPSEYVTLEGANFEPDSSSLMDYMANYNGKTVYVVFEKTFSRPSDVCVPAEMKYICRGTPLYVIE